MSKFLKFILTSAAFILTSLVLWGAFLLINMGIYFIIICRVATEDRVGLNMDYVGLFYPLMFVLGAIIITRHWRSSKNIWLYPLSYGVFLIISLLMRQPPMFHAIECYELLILLSPIPLSFMVAVLGVKRNWGSVRPE